MEQHYAQALWQMVKDGMTPHKAVTALTDLLEKQGRRALLPRIASAFARIAERESKTSTMVLTVAREWDEREARKEASEVLKKLGVGDMPAGKAGLETQVDDSIIGGWRLEGRSTLVDQSHKSRLLALYNRVVSQ